MSGVGARILQQVELVTDIFPGMLYCSKQVLVCEYAPLMKIRLNKLTQVNLCCLLLVASLPVYGQNLSASDEGLEAWQGLEADLAVLQESLFIPGLAFAVVKDGELLGANGYGFADANREVPISPDTPFWVASVTKTFVGLAYLHLEAEGRVDFSENAHDTPNFSDLCEWLANTTIPFATGLDCRAQITIGHILTHQVNDPLGTQFMYNPIMYSRLSRHLEHRFGEGVDAVEGRHNALGQLIDRTIMDPAGMDRSMSSMWDRSKALVYFDMSDGFAINAEGYRTKMAKPDKHIAGGAGVVSTVLDLAKYEKALYSGLIAPPTIKQKLEQAVRFNNGDLAPYGYGWYFECYRGQRLMWHSGWDEENGFSALYLRVPEQGLAFVALANSEGIWWQNPLDDARVRDSEFAQRFMDRFLFATDLPPTSAACQ